MSAVQKDKAAPCPHCGKLEGVDLIVVPPVDERDQKGDRRKNPPNTAQPFPGDRRKNPDRRSANHGNSAQPHGDQANMVCLACNHTWHHAAG